MEPVYKFQKIYDGGAESKQYYHDQIGPNKQFRIEIVPNVPMGGRRRRRRRHSRKRRGSRKLRTRRHR